jgi:hypothetical protein
MSTFACFFVKFSMDGMLTTCHVKGHRRSGSEHPWSSNGRKDRLRQLATNDVSNSII